MTRGELLAYALLNIAGCAVLLWMYYVVHATAGG